MGRSIASLAAKRDDVEIVDEATGRLHRFFRAGRARRPSLGRGRRRESRSSIGTTGLAADHQRAIDAAAREGGGAAGGEHLARRRRAARAGRAGGAAARARLGRRDLGDAPPRQARHAVGHRAAARRARSTGPRRRRPTELNRFDRMQEGPHAREHGRHLLCLAARRHGRRRASGDLRRRRRADRARPPRREPGDLRQGRGAAALWLRTASAGRYTMADVLGL